VTASWRREDTRLTVRQKAGWLWVLRLVIGLPVLLFGTLMLWLTVSEPVHRFIEGGWPAVFSWLPSTLFSLVFAALTAPLGWWLVMSHSEVVVDASNRKVLEVRDWRLGRKVTIHDAGIYSKVSVERDYLMSVQESRSSTNTLAHYVRLRGRGRHAVPLQIAFFDTTERAKPEELGRLVAEMLGLPVTVNLDEIARQSANDEE
jgi:hypothetical protein